jgi:low affinity Fe/Cu permease
MEIPMSKNKPSFASLANGVADLVGRPLAFILALTAVVAWALSGPLFAFSEIWQLVINTGTTIITFLMIFLLQNSQNRDSKAIQAKLDELILTSTSAQNKFIGIEALDEKELLLLREMIQAKACADEDANNPNAQEAPQKAEQAIVERTRAELQKIAQ